MRKKYVVILILCAILLLILGAGYYQRYKSGDGEYPPIVRVMEQNYIITGHTLKNVDENALVQIGVITDTIAKGAPEKNFQANIPIKGAPVYMSTDCEMYEQNYLLEGDILVYYDEKYMIFEILETGQEWMNRKVMQY